MLPKIVVAAHIVFYAGLWLLPQLLKKPRIWFRNLKKKD